MKPNNQKRALFDAVTNIDEDLIAEAGAPRALSFPKNIKRIAAIAAAVAILITAVALWPADENYVTGPGILMITAYAADGEPFVTSSPDMVEPFFLRWGPFVNWAPGCPITLEMTDENYSADDITFQVTVDGGGYYVGADGGSSIYPGISKTMPTQFTVPNNTTIFWSMNYDASSGQHGFQNCADSYTSIVVYEGSKIIGYVVIKFDRLTYGEINPEHYSQLGIPLDLLSNEFDFSLIASVSFPKVDGEYQNITLDYVNECIAKAYSN